MSVPILANAVLGLISAGKIMRSSLSLWQNPFLLSENVRVAQMNVILAYVCLLFMPMAQRKLKRWEDTKHRMSYEEVIAMGEEAVEIKNFMNYVGDIKEELAYKDASMITHLLVPAYIVMFLYKSYTKVAVALHFANGFV